MKNKIIASLTLLAMLLTTNVALAAQIITDTTSTDNRWWRQTFSELTENTAPEKMTLTDITAMPDITTGSQGGLFGKTADDDAFFVSKAAIDDPEATPTTSTITLRTNDNVLSGMRTYIASTVSLTNPLPLTKSFRLSFDLAIDSYGAERNFGLQTWWVGAARDIANAIVKINSTGGVSLLGGTAPAGFTMPLNKWVRFDVIIDTPAYNGGSKASLYANGQLITSRNSYDFNSSKTNYNDGAGTVNHTDPLLGINNMYFQFPQTATQGSSYVDNMQIVLNSPIPIIMPLTLTHSNPEIAGKIDNTDFVMKLPDKFTAEQLKDGLSIDGSYITTQAGTEQTGSLQPGYAAVPYEDDYIYYSIETYHEETALNENFNNLSAVEKGMLEAAVAGRSDADKSLVFDAEDILEYSFSPVTSSDFVINTSILKRGENAPVITAVFDQTPVQFPLTDMREDMWYRYTAQVNLEAGTWSIYANGKPVTMNAAIFQDGKPAALTAFLIEMFPESAVDDIMLQSGQYSNGEDNITVTAADTNTIILNNQIYISENTDTDTFLKGLTLSQNCAFSAAYLDKRLSQKVENGMVSNGNWVVFKSAVDSVYESYEIKVLDEAFSVKEINARYELYDDHIIIPAYSLVSKVLSYIALYPGHAGTVIDGEGQTVANTLNLKYLDKNSQYKYRITYKNHAGTYTKDYRLISYYDDFTFEDFPEDNVGLGYKFGSFAFNRQGSSGGTFSLMRSTDPDNEDEYIAEAKGAPTTAGSGNNLMTFRLDNAPLSRIDQPFVLSWDFKMPSNYQSTVWITGVRQDKSSYGPLEFYEFEAGGPVKFERVNRGTWKGSEWNRAIMVIYPGNGTSRIFLNGKQIFNGNTAYQKVLDYATSFNISYYMVNNSTRTVLMDNMRFYPIDSVGAFEADDMNSAATQKTGMNILSNGKITGYGPGTETQFLNLFNFPQGAERGVFNADGLPLEDNDQVEPEYFMKVTSADGMYSTTYPIGEKVRITAPKLRINGNQMKYLIPGDATATAEIYSALPYKAQLALTYSDGTNSNTVYAQRTESDSGLTELVTPSAGNVQNVEGETLYLTFTDPDTGADITPPQSLVWTGQLNLDSEICDVKNGANSIVTITMDDSLIGTLEYANGKFAELGLRGTSMAVAERVRANVNGFRGIFNQGYIDVANHGETMSPFTANSSDATIQKELVDAAESLRSLLPGQEVLTYAPANHILYPASEAVAMNNFWAIRRGDASVFNDDSDATGFNSLDPPNDNSFGGWYRLRQVGGHTKSTIGGVSYSTDELVKMISSDPDDEGYDSRYASKWLIEMYHNILADSKATGDLDTKQSAANTHFKLLSDLQKSGKIWVASFPEAMKYIRERQNTELVDIALETGRTITLTTDTTKLPPEIFNVPLSIRSQVPDEWDAPGKYVKVTQGGNVQSPAIQNIDGGLYIIYDAYINNASISLECVDEKPIVTVNGIKISRDNSSGPLTQELDEAATVTFTASTTPSENTDTSGITWFVNGEESKDTVAGMLSFDFTPSDVGKFEIYAYDKITGLKSPIMTVTVKEPGLYAYSDFQNYNLGAAIATSIDAAQFPKESSNIAARVSYDSTNTWPAIHKEADCSVEDTTVWSGRVALVGSNQSFFLEARNTKTVNSTNRKTVMMVTKDGNIRMDDNENLGKIPKGKWLHFSMAITPAPASELSTLRLTLSSPDLTDANGNNKGKTIVITKEINLDLLEMPAAGSLNMVYNNNFTTAADGNFTYIDNIRMYQTKPLRLLMPKNAVVADAPLKIDLSTYAYDLSLSDINVVEKDNPGNIVTVESVEYDKTDPLSITLAFSAGALKKETAYIVTADSVAAIDAGGSLLFATGEFLTGTADPITTLEIASVGETEQSIQNLLPITFTAMPNDPETADYSTIEWLVDNIVKGNGETFAFTPSQMGTYKIKASVRDTDIMSSEITVTVVIGPAASLNIASTGITQQYADDLTPVTFTVSENPTGSDLDDVDVQWLVNDELYQEGGKTLIYTPTGVGKFGVSAKISNKEESQTETINITVFSPDPDIQTYILKDNFENHDVGTDGKLTDANKAPWSAVLSDADKWEIITKDPTNPDNKVVQFVPNRGSTDAWPRLEKSGVTVAANTPLAFSGKVYMKTTNSRIYLELGSSSFHRLLDFENGKVVLAGDTAEETAANPKWSVGGWIWFSVYLEPGETAADPALLRVTLSGDAITGTNKTIEKQISLSTVGFGSRTVRFNVRVKQSTGDAVYLDNARIYSFAPVVPVATTPKAGASEIELLLSHYIDPNSLPNDITNSVIVKDNEGQYTVTAVDFDPLSPDRMIVYLQQPMIERRDYEVSFASGVLDIDGTAITQKAVFSIGTLETGEFTIVPYFVEGETISASATSLTAKADITIDSIIMEKHVTMYIAQYGENGRLKKLWPIEETFVPSDLTQTISLPITFSAVEGDSFKLFIWNEKNLPYSETKTLKVIQ